MNSKCMCPLLSGQCNSVRAADVVFLVDGSSSIGRSNFQLVKGFMSGLVKPFASAVGGSGVRFGVVQYSDSSRLEIHSPLGLRWLMLYGLGGLTICDK